MNNPEQFHGSAENTIESQRAAGERSAELLKNYEAAGEQSPEKTAEQIEDRRNEVREVFAQDKATESRNGGEPGFVRAVRRVTSQEKQLAYKATMQHIRTQMSAPARTFSKFIHNTGVEKASGILGNSVARPNAVLSGSTCALVLVSLVYVIAKIFGYPLSGFETIGAFVLGWIIGFIYDYTRALVAGRVQ